MVAFSVLFTQLIEWLRPLGMDDVYPLKTWITLVGKKTTAEKDPISL